MDTAKQDDSAGARYGDCVGGESGYWHRLGAGIDRVASCYIHPMLFMVYAEMPRPIGSPSENSKLARNEMQRSNAAFRPLAFSNNSDAETAIRARPHERFLSPSTEEVRDSPDQNEPAYNHEHIR